MNLTSVQSAPIFVSKPHFLDADEYYINNVHGLTPPDRKKHDIFLQVEPKSGMTVNARKCLQVNAKVEPMMMLYPNLRETYFPVAWFSEYGKIDKKDANDLNLGMD